MILLGALGLLFLQGAPAASTSSGCVVCHGEQGRDLGQSVHLRAGVDCTACHGGDPSAMEVEQAHGDSLRRLRERREIVASCGGCHADVERMRLFGLRTDQLSLYGTSRHGQKLAEDPKAEVAVCSSCHGAHAVRAADDPLSPTHPRRQVETCGACHSDPQLTARYGLPGGEVEAYRGSVHGRALIDEELLAAPACTDCHGSHGAVPPRFADIEAVCGHCHATVQEHFDASPHVRSRSDGNAAVECISCHGNHAVGHPSGAMFEGDEPGHCGECHPEGVGTALDVGRELHHGIAGLAEDIDEADGEVRAASGRGVFLGAERGYLDEARGMLVRARAMTHRLSPQALEDVLNRGRGMVLQTREGLDTKQRTFRDRQIFATVFAAVSAAFALVLVLYGRTIGGRWKGSGGGAGGA